MASIADILRTIQNTITASVNAYGIQTPGQVIIGWPTGPQLESEIGSGEWIISLFPLRSKPMTRYRPSAFLLPPAPAQPTIVATVTTGSTFSTIALSGANSAGQNIHTVFGLPKDPVDAYYETTGSETLPQIAVNVAALVNSFAVTGCSATPIGSTIRITGPWPVFCNSVQTVAGQYGVNAYGAQEIARFQRDIQVTIWAASPDQFAPLNDATRENLETAMLTSIGGTNQPFNTASDGSPFSAIWESTGDWSDKAESSYSLFKSINFLRIEYGLLIPVSITPIGAIDVQQQIETETGYTIAGSAQTYSIGGP